MKLKPKSACCDPKNLFKRAIKIHQTQVEPHLEVTGSFLFREIDEANEKNPILSYENLDFQPLTLQLNNPVDKLLLLITQIPFSFSVFQF